MKGLTGERKRWPVLINRRRDTPKVSHSQAHNGVLHQAEPGMEYGRSEWRQGEKKKRGRERLKPSFSLHPSLFLYFYFIALAPGLWSHSSLSIQRNGVRRIPLVSFVNMGPGSVYERMAHFQNLSNAGLFCSFKCCSIPSSPHYSLPRSIPFSLPLSFRCINSGWSQERW